MEHFETGKKLDASSLTKIRHKLGVEFTKELERKTYQVLIKKKIIRGKGMLVDATVMPEKIKYPNDIGLLNDVREWAVGIIKEIVRKTGEKVRTYRWKAKKLYMNFTKKKLKTRQMIERTKKQMLQYVRRNLEQLKARVGQLDYLVRKEVEERLKVAERIYEQQKRMYDEKVQHVRRKQRERNRIEGDIGNVKEHYGLDGIRYHYQEGSEMWVRLGLLAKNLKAALARMALMPAG